MMMMKSSAFYLQLAVMFAFIWSTSPAYATIPELVFEQALPLQVMRSGRLSVSRADPARVQYQVVSSVGSSAAKYTRTAVFDPTSGRLLRTYAGTAEQSRAEQTLASANAYIFTLSSVCFIGCFPDGYVIESYNEIGRISGSRYRGYGEFSGLRTAGNFFSTDNTLRDPITAVPIASQGGCVNLEFLSSLNVVLYKCGGALEARLFSNNSLLWRVESLRPELRLSPDQRLISVVGEDSRVRILNVRGQILAVSEANIGTGIFAADMIWANSGRLLVRTTATDSAQLFVFSVSGDALNLLWQRPDQLNTVAVDSTGRIYGVAADGNGRFTPRMSADGLATERLPFFLGVRTERLYRIPQIAAVAVEPPQSRVLEAWDIDSLQRVWRKEQPLLPNLVRHVNFLRDDTIWSIKAVTTAANQLQLGVVLHSAQTGALMFQSPAAANENDNVPLTANLLWAASGTYVAALATSGQVDSFLASYDAQGQLRWQNSLALESLDASSMSANEQFIALHGYENDSALLFDAQTGQFIRHTALLTLLPNGLAIETERFASSRLVQARTGALVATLQANMLFDASSQLIVGFERAPDNSLRAVVSNLAGIAERHIDFPEGSVTQSFVFDGVLVRSDFGRNESFAYDLRTGALRFRTPYVVGSKWEVAADRWRTGEIEGRFARSAQVQSELNPNTGERAVRVLGVHAVQNTSATAIGQHQNNRIVVENHTHLLAYRDNVQFKPWALENKADVRLSLEAIGGADDALTFALTLSNIGPSATQLTFAAQALDERVELRLLRCSACNVDTFSLNTSRVDLPANTALTFTLSAKRRFSLGEFEAADEWTKGTLNLLGVSAYADVDTLDPDFSNNQFSVALNQEQIFRGGFEGN